MFNFHFCKSKKNDMVATMMAKGEQYWFGKKFGDIEIIVRKHTCKKCGRKWFDAIDEHGNDTRLNSDYLELKWKKAGLV